MIKEAKGKINFKEIMQNRNNGSAFFVGTMPTGYDADFNATGRTELTYSNRTGLVYNEDGDVYAQETEYMMDEDDGGETYRHYKDDITDIEAALDQMFDGLYEVC